MGVEVVFWSVVLARFTLPLLIPRYPLPAIVGCLLLDGVDQTIFQTFGYDPPSYQSYDKAMDVFYLVRRLSGQPAQLDQPGRGPRQPVPVLLPPDRGRGVRVERRAGAAAVVPEHVRVLLHRLRGHPHPVEPGTLHAARSGSLIAGAIWVFVKLPQEYWIHIAQLDLTDTIRDDPGSHPRWRSPCSRSPRSPASSCARGCSRPTGRGDSAPTRCPPRSTRRVSVPRTRPFTAGSSMLTTLEKTVLIGLISIIYGRRAAWGRGEQPAGDRRHRRLHRSSTPRSGCGRHGGATRGSPPRVSFAVVFATNVVLVALADLLLSRGDGGLRLVDTLFFVFLFSILTTLYDRYHPISDYRAAAVRNDVSA